MNNAHDFFHGASCAVMDGQVSELVGGSRVPVNDDQSSPLLFGHKRKACSGKPQLTGTRL